MAVALIYILSMFIITQSYRMYSRTVNERQFDIGNEYWNFNLKIFRQLETQYDIKPESHNGLRISIEEWPRWRYLITLETLPDGTAKGVLFAQTLDSETPLYERKFKLDRQKTKALLASFDERIDGYWGSTTQCVDGTYFQFERWVDRKVSGGQGNAACQEHYAELMSIVAEPLSVELKDAPFDWYSWFSSKRELMLRDSGQ